MAVLGFSLLTTAAIVLLCLQEGGAVLVENRQPDEAVREDVPERCPTRHSPVAPSRPFGMSF